MRVWWTRMTASLSADRMKADQGIEEKESWPDAAHGLEEPGSVSRRVEAKPRRGDHVEVDRLQHKPSLPCHSSHAFADDLERVLGKVDEHRPTLEDLEGPERGSPRGYAQRHVEG